MARSQKDGKKGGAHRMGTRSKWREAKERRHAQKDRREWRTRMVSESAAEEKAINEEMYQDYLSQEDVQWDWASDYFEWKEENYDEYITDEDLEYGWGHDSDWDQPPLDPEPKVDVFEAVDRAVRRYGVDMVMTQSPFIAALLDVPSWEVHRAVRLTRAGYIR